MLEHSGTGQKILALFRVVKEIGRSLNRRFPIDITLRSSLLGFWIAFCIPGIANAEGVEQYIPGDRVIRGSLMELVAPRDLQNIVAKFQAAAQNDQDWFKSYIAKHADSQPLPYHPRLGITQAEYDRFLKISETLDLQEKAAVIIKVEQLDDGSLRLVSDDNSLPLNGIRLLPAQNVVETKYGKLGTFTKIDQADPDSPTGRWTGVQWSKLERTGQGAMAVKLAIGKRTDHGDGIIYFDVQNFMSGMAEEYHVIVLYPLQ